jgi:Flp pilus assembly protein TadG
MRSAVADGEDTRRNSRGQSLVEFALTLPVFLLVVFGAIDMARYYNTQEQMTHVIRSALRKAVVYRTDDSSNTLTRREYFIQQAQAANGKGMALVLPPTNPNSASSTDSIIMNPANCGDHDQDVTVTIQKSFRFITPFLNEIAAGAGGSYPYTMKVTIKSRVEP